MRVVNHEVQEIVEVPDDFEEMLRHIEKVGRICYQSQERITEDSAEKFVKMLFRRGHWAMLEHSWLVFTSYPLDWDQWKHLYELTDSNFLQVLVDDNDERIPIICGNWRAWFEQIIGPAKDNKNNFELFKQLPDIIKELFSAYDITLDRVHLNKVEDPYLYPKAYTATFLTDRAVTHEMVRHRPCAFAQKCVTGDTIVHKKGKKEITIKELYERSKTQFGKTHNKTIRLKSVDQYGKIIPNKIKEVFYNGKANVYKVRTELGYEIKSTINHRFQKEDGQFVILGNLKVNDCIMVNGKKVLQYNISDDEITRLYVDEEYSIAELSNVIYGLDYNHPRPPNYYNRNVVKHLKKLGIYNPTRNPEKYNKNHTTESYTNVARNLLDSNGNPWNKGKKGENSHVYGTRRSEETRRKIGEAKKGDKNHSWIGGAPVRKGHYEARLKKKEIKCCELCGKEGKLEVHHIDRDINNNDCSNIIKACINCHNKLHFGWNIGTIAHSDKIVSIEFVGIEDVYDIEMESPFHNYIANGIVVHNSQRYCADREYLEFVAPYYLDLTSDSSTGVYMWMCLMNRIEEDYHFALRNGQTAQEARSMLPNCTATQIAMTADIVEWEHVFDMRCASDAYPPIRKLMREVKETFKHRGYIKDKQK